MILLISLILFISSCSKKPNTDGYDIFVNSSTIEIDKSLTYQKIKIPDQKEQESNNFSYLSEIHRVNFNHKFDEGNAKINELNFSVQLFHKQDINRSNVPIFYQDKLISLDKNNEILAFDIKEKYKKWSYAIETKNKITISKMTLYNNTILVSTSEGWLIKLNPETGKEIDKKKFNFQFFSHFICEGKFCYGTNASDTLFKVNFETLTITKTHKKMTSNNYLSHQSPNPIFYHDFVIYVNSSNYITCLNKETLEEIWSFKLYYSKSTGAFAAVIIATYDPLIYKDVLIVGNPKVFTAAINPTNGSLLWVKNFGIKSQITAVDDFIFFVDDESRLNCIYYKTGAIKWSLQLEKFKSYKVPKYLNYGSDINAEVFYSTPLIANNKIFIGNYFGELLLIKIKNGEIIRKIDIPYFINGSFTFIKQALYMTNTFNGIYEMK